MADGAVLRAAAATSAAGRRQPTAEATNASRLTDELQPLVKTANEAAKLVNDAEVRAMSHPAVRAWLVAFQEAMYDLDDAVDDYECHVEKQEQQPPPEEEARKSIRRWLWPSSTVHSKTEYKKMKTNIEKLNKKMHGILQHGRQLDLKQINRQRQNWMSKLSGDLATHCDILGDVEQEKMKLIDILTDSQSSSVVVAIVGCCGIGKTTLARKVHDDCYARNAFNAIIWVCGSKDFTDVKLLSAIVSAAGGKPRAEQSKEKIKGMLSAMLEGKRFLLVLDDVWSHQIHENFLESRLLVKHGSRILITTRDQSVAKRMNSGYIHTMQELPFHDCWSLLCSSAGLDKKHDCDNLRELGIMVIQRCNKVPLSIKIIGGVLGTMDPTREQWQQVNESEGWSCSLEDIPRGMEKIIGPVYMAYTNLPYCLKLCFLYCLQFPEGFVIRQHAVTQLWVSEGFINEENNGNPEDIAEGYYKELVLRNLLEPEIGSVDMTRCTVRGCVRSLLELFTKNLWFGKNRRTSSIELKATLKSFRTIVYNNPLGDRVLDKVFMGLRYSRVLDLTGTGIRHIPESLVLLVHLRYLNLSLTQITELPETIESLRNLQFLVLQYCYGLHALPEGISKLHNLRSLDLEGTAPQLVLPRLVDLWQLTTLHGFIVNHKAVNEKDLSGWPLEDLKSLNSLRSLQIVKIDRVLQNSRAQEAALALKSHLTQLELCGSTSDMHVYVPDKEARRLNDVLNSLCPPRCLESLKIASYYGQLFPDWILHLPNLQRLVLADCKFCESLPSLGQLPQLKFLSITSCSKLRIIQRGQTSSTQAFPKLEHLHLDDMENLESLKGFKAGDLPSLVKLHLDNCPNLRSLPSCIEYSKELTGMQIVAASSLKVIDNLPVLKELVVQDSKSLTIVSNLPSLEVLMVAGCSRLQDVKGVKCLRHLRIVDRELTRLPDWLTRHTSVLQTLTVFGTEELLSMLVPNGEDWSAIRDIDKVYGNLTDGSPFFTYTKNTGDFQAFGEQRDLVVRSVVAHQLEVWSSHIMLRNFAVRISRIGMTNTIKRYFIPPLAAAMVLLLLTGGEIKHMGIFLIFFATIACFWPLYFYIVHRTSN